jgi:hypothetical protein
LFLLPGREHGFFGRILRFLAAMMVSLERFRALKKRLCFLFA